jgi:hypothetical protein
MKKIRGDKPIGVIIHIYMEISQGNPCVATYISKKQKCHFFFFLLKIRSCRKGVFGTRGREGGGLERG